MDHQRPKPAPRRLVGSLFEPLLLPSETRFTELVGIGTRHRWVFHDPTGDTLLIDPLIADPTPKLPAWTITVDKGTAGWDDADYPAVSHGDPSASLRLEESEWRTVQAPDKLNTQLLIPATSPSTHPTSQAAIGTTAVNHTRWHEIFRRQNFTHRSQSQRRKNHLAPSAHRGGILRTHPHPHQRRPAVPVQSTRPIAPHPAHTHRRREPFKLEAVFTKDIPNSDHPHAHLAGPGAAESDFVSDDNVLTVTFPAGHIPNEISRMMLDGGH